MGNLDSLIAADSALSLADFGEAAQYIPKGGVARDIQIIIDRTQPSTVPGAPGGFAPYSDIWIRNHATLGTTSINTGGDAISFAPRQGGTRAQYDIAEIVEQDLGMWHVRIRTNGK